MMIMIPSDWLPHRRESDDELVGYLAPVGDDFLPLTVFGYPLGVAADYLDAAALLEAEGMACLAEYWWFEPAAVGRGGDGYRVRIHEATPDRLTVVVDDFGVGADLGTRVDLPVPVTAGLTRL